MKLNPRIILAAGFLFTAFIVFANTTPAQEDRVKEIVEKHIASISSKEGFAAIQNRLVTGQSEFESKLPSRKTGGKALIASRKGDFMFLTSYLSKEYPYEKIGFFADKISLPWVTAGTRSPLGTFLADHEKLLSDGLFAGAISDRWALLDLEQAKARLKFAGRKKIDGKELLVLDYFPRGSGSSEFSIQLFFDSETHRHVRSEYRHVISPQMDPFGTLGRQTGVKLSLTEHFDDFRTVDGFTLPYTYRADYSTSSNSGTYEYIWGIRINDYIFNQNLAENFFTFDAK